MPIPQYPTWLPFQANAPDETPPYDVTERSRGEESVSLQRDHAPLAVLPIPDSVEPHRNHSNDETSQENICTDRAELIERIKRGESPTWVPNKAVSGAENGQKPAH